MAWVKVTENGKSTVLKVSDEKCDHGFDLLIRFQEQSGVTPNDAEAWARFEELRAKHVAEDKQGIYR